MTDLNAKMAKEIVERIDKDPDGYFGEGEKEIREYFKACGYIQCHAQAEEILAKAIEIIRSTNGLQYSDIFQICDKALSAWRELQEK